jgi:preprotein translocase subunit SecG
MITLNTLILIAHVLIAAGIIGLVMLQKGKGADAGAGFGAGASGTVFGARGSANFLSRTTAVMAALFFATSMGLAYLNRNLDVAPSLLDKGAVQEQPADAAVATAPATAEVELELPPLPDAAAASSDVEQGTAGQAVVAPATETQE